MANPTNNRVIFPLDVSDEDEAWHWCFQLQGLVGTMKVGLELFTALGPEILKAPYRTGYDIFLDLKLHDIPATVAKAAMAAARHRIKFLTVHAAGGPAMLQAAVEATRQISPDTTVLAVTVLTSLTVVELDAMFGLEDHSAHGFEQVVGRLAVQAWDAGVRGFVCSPLEVATLRRVLGPEAVLVVPGVRPLGADDNDQKRVATPTKAMEDGANYLVVGRPIRHAADPVAAALAIAAEIQPFVR